MRRFNFAVVVVMIGGLLAQDASAGIIFGRHRAKARFTQVTRSTACGNSAIYSQTTRLQVQGQTPCSGGSCPAPQRPQAAPAPQASYSTANDPASFLTWLNATRAAYGLSAVGYDQNLANWAAVNNQHQNSRGMGHYVMGPARRQNAALGGNNLGNRWMNSPSHRAALLDPSIRAIGLAGSGSYWTFNAN